jgi:hypothetical protein
MNQTAEARVFAVPEPAEPVRPGARHQIDSTARAVAWADDAPVRQAMDGFSWERRGLFARLVRRPRG